MHISCVSYLINLIFWVRCLLNCCPSPGCLNVREGDFERGVVLIHAGAVTEYIEQIGGHGTSLAGEIIIPQTDGRQYNTAYRLQFNSCYVVFQPSAVREAVHIRDELYRSVLVVIRVGQSEDCG